MRLAVIILSYNTKALLRQAISSVLASAALTADRLTVDVVVPAASLANGARMIEPPDSVTAPDTSPVRVVVPVVL